MTLAEAKPAARPAVDTRIMEPASPRYAACDTCGTVTAVSTRALDRGTNGFEVRVHFATGNWTFLYPTNPGFASGDRVKLQAGRLTRM